jgi:hypothetical protein
MTAQVKKLQDWHREVLRMLVQGYRIDEIAQALTCTTAMVQIIARSPIAKRHLSVLQSQRDETAVNVARSIKIAAPKAFALVDRALDGDAELALKGKERVDAAFKMLEFAGYKPRETVSSIRVGLVSQDMLKQINDIAKENIIDAEFVDEEEEIA